MSSRFQAYAPLSPYEGTWQGLRYQAYTTFLHDGATLFLSLHVNHFIYGSYIVRNCGNTEKFGSFESPPIPETTIFLI